MRASYTLIQHPSHSNFPQYSVTLVSEVTSRWLQLETQPLTSIAREKAESRGGAKAQLLLRVVASGVKLLEAECRASNLPPALSGQTVMKTLGAPGRTPGDQRHDTLLSEVATAAPPAPLSVPGDELLYMDPPGSSEDVVHLDLVSKLNLSVLQQDSLSERSRETKPSFGLQILSAENNMSNYYWISALGKI